MSSAIPSASWMQKERGRSPVRVSISTSRRQPVTQGYLYLTHRPYENVTNELNFVAGFDFAPDQPATLTVGGKSFDLFTQKDSAWLLDASQNDNLAGALRAGNQVIVEGATSTGIAVTETFSLSGATAASRAIDGC